MDPFNLNHATCSSNSIKNCLHEAKRIPNSFLYWAIELRVEFTGSFSCVHGDFKNNQTEIKHLFLYKAK